MRVVLILLGLLLLVGGGAVAGAQYAPPDLLKMLDSAPAQARDFLMTPTALYAGAGGAGFGLLLVIIAAVTGGKKKEKPVKAKREKAKPQEAKGEAPEPAPVAKPAPAKPVPAKPAPVAAAPPPQKAPEPRPPEPEPAPAPQPAMAAAAPQPAPAPQPPRPKPQASAQPPAAAPAADGPADKVTLADTARTTPRLHNRRRVSDLVTINDALKAYFKKNGSYPAASGLGGVMERGAAWIPGLAPEFLPELPLDPVASTEAGGPQYVYASDGKDYKLLAHNVSLVGSTSVEVLGVKIDMTRQPTMENASFGYWTPGFAEV
ncbi:MAG: hypothetical protein B7Z22_00055 [Hyphomonas sp. 32-62-5]|nr:MAG: hypothetical protein B7Z22_00055 [Hyphomonas sp. 32-62-5]